MKKSKMSLVTLVIGLILCMTFSMAFHCYADGNVINGCYQKVNGQLRTVSDPGECRPSEVPISWSMIGPQGPIGLTGPQGPKGDTGATGPQGTEGTMPKYANVIVVAKSGGDFTSPVDAMNAITDASATNPYLVKIMPCVYNVGTNSVQMKPYVDIEGSGENTTEITGNVTGGLLIGASNAEIRLLKVWQMGGGIAIYNYNASPKITNVTAICSGGTDCSGVYNEASSPIMSNVTAVASLTVTNSYGAYGVYNHNASSPIMTNVTATASNGGRFSTGVLNSGSPPTMTNVTAIGSGITGSIGVSMGVSNQVSTATMTNVTATASGGTENYGIYNYRSSSTMRNITATATGSNSIGIRSVYAGTVTIDQSVIYGATYAINNGGATYEGTTIFVGSTKLAGGGVINNFGTLKCVGVYDGNYNQITCP